MNDLQNVPLPPQAIEIERSLLAACMLDNSAIDDCAEILNSDDFYRTAHQIIFKTAFGMREKKQPVDAATLGRAIKDAGKIEEIGGSVYLAKILDEAPMSPSVTHHAKIVKDKSVLRQIIHKAHKTAQAAYEAQSATELLDQAQQSFLDISNPLAFKFCTMAELMEQGVDQIEKCAKGKQDVALPTGLIELDNNMGGGIHGAKLMIICARPGVGKTAIMLNMAGGIAATFAKRNIGERVGVLELEMEKEELSVRSIAMKSGINTVYLFAGREKRGDSWQPLSQDNWTGITSAAEKLSRYPILIDDTPALPLQEVVRRIRMMHKQGCRVVFIDQLSKIRGPGSKEYEQKTAIVNRLAELKKELRIPIVLLAQINREGFLKSTGALEEDADIIMRLKQTNEALDQSGEVFKASLEIEKHRGGPTGEIELQWVPKITAFRNISDTVYS